MPNALGILSQAEVAAWRAATATDPAPYERAVDLPQPSLNRALTPSYSIMMDGVSQFVRGFSPNRNTQMLYSTVTQDMPIREFKSKLRDFAVGREFVLCGITKEDTPHVEVITMAAFVGPAHPPFDFNYVQQLWYDTTNDEIKVRREDDLTWKTVTRFYKIWNNTVI